MKIYIYMKWEKKSQVTNLKDLITKNYHKIRGKNFLLTIWHSFKSFPPCIFGFIFFDHLFIWQWICGIVWRESNKIIQLFSSIQISCWVAVNFPTQSPASHMCGMQWGYKHKFGRSILVQERAKRKKHGCKKRIQKNHAGSKSIS